MTKINEKEEVLYQTLTLDLHNAVGKFLEESTKESLPVNLALSMGISALSRITAQFLSVVAAAMNLKEIPDDVYSDLFQNIKKVTQERIKKDLKN